MEAMNTPTPVDLRPGDLMFGPIGGFVPGVFPVGIGQLALAPRKARLSWRRWWHVRHVGVVVEAFQWLEHPRIVQAMPRGAEEVNLIPRLHWTAQHVYVRPAYPLAAFGTHDSTGSWLVAERARSYVGTPYNFLTYGALAASALHLPISRRVLRKWISTRHDMMCSQLADQALADAGYHVFDDGRLPQDVVPAELFRELLTKPGTQYLIPGQPFGWRATGWLDA